MTTTDPIRESNDYTWTTDGKSKAEALPPGPWQDEPDKLVWIDETTGLDCMIVRGPLGSLCGYVGVPPDHPMHGQDYDRGFDADIHGGLTYADKCQGTICHVPEPGRPHDVWWFGFDCAHGSDVSPGMIEHNPGLFGEKLDGDPMWRRTYKTIAYVTDEVTSLATQLADRAVRTTK